ncbi:MAG: hypothetical protein IJ261_03715 [Clostridia bacterium]|nr:hypothetical protein [Clostridia bacterium]
MLEKACKCLKTIGRAEKLLKILYAVRITVFAVTAIYAVTMGVSMIKQNCCK